MDASSKLLILDEPTNGLDPQGMAEMRKLITQIGQGDRTLLISSHLLGEVQQTCGRVVGLVVLAAGLLRLRDVT